MSIYVGMVAGETSGDLLAARVLHGLQRQCADIQCAGIGGSAMVAAGFDAWYDIERLAVFGYIDAFKRLPGLIHTYTRVRRRWLHQPPDVFVGIDAPDINLRLQKRLRKAGVPTVQFVSPSIWAWRYERIHTIRAAVSHMLVLFPFEADLYEREGVPVTYVGHPMASAVPMQTDQAQARRTLGLPEDVRVLAILPGSRTSEIRLLADRFLQAAAILQQQDPDLHFVIPVTSQKRLEQLQPLLQKRSLKHCQVLNPAVQQQAGTPVAWTALQAADAALVASGTATLEAALFKRPMVISYVLSPAMRRIMAWQSGQQKPLLPWIGLPNILAQDFIVPELLQEAATPEALASETWKALTDTAYRQRLHEHYSVLHHLLRRDTGTLAAQAILQQAG